VTRIFNRLYSLLLLA
jgi:hypothetical protein